MPKAIEMLPNLISKKFEEVPGSKVSGSKIVELKKKLVVNLASLASLTTLTTLTFFDQRFQHLLVRIQN